MMVEDFSESGHAVREKRTQTYPPAWESLTLRDIVAFLAEAKELGFKELGFNDELFWLDQLEKFFLSV